MKNYNFFLPLLPIVFAALCSASFVLSEAALGDETGLSQEELSEILSEIPGPPALKPWPHEQGFGRIDTMYQLPSGSIAGRWASDKEEACLAKNNYTELPFDRSEWEEVRKHNCESQNYFVLEVKAKRPSIEFEKVVIKEAVSVITSSRKSGSCAHEGKWVDCFYIRESEKRKGFRSGSWIMALPKGYEFCEVIGQGELSANPRPGIWEIFGQTYSAVITYEIADLSGFPVGGEDSWLKVHATLLGSNDGC